MKKNQCLKDIKKYRFPHRTVDTWNGLKEEVVTATNIHKFKEMLDIWRYGDTTLWALLKPCVIQLGKYTHTLGGECVWWLVLKTVRWDQPETQCIVTRPGTERYKPGIACRMTLIEIQMHSSVRGLSVVMIKAGEWRSSCDISNGHKQNAGCLSELWHWVPVSLGQGLVYRIGIPTFTTSYYWIHLIVLFYKLCLSCVLLYPALPLTLSRVGLTLQQRVPVSPNTLATLCVLLNHPLLEMKGGCSDTLSRNTATSQSLLCKTLQYTSKRCYL